jgi:ribonuclease D
VLTEADVPFPELFDRLRQWRKEKADAMGAPAYTILHQKALVQIVCHLPVSENALLALPGIGPATVEKHGAELVKQIMDYCADAGIDAGQHKPPQAAVAETPVKPKPKNSETGIASFYSTLERFQAGLTMESIASERNMALSTIENHLAQALEQGLLKLADLIPEEAIIADIQSAIKAAEGTAMRPIKDALGETVSYGQIRWVQAHLKHIESSKFDHESV